MVSQSVIVCSVHNISFSFQRVCKRSIPLFHSPFSFLLTDHRINPIVIKVKHLSDRDTHSNNQGVAGTFDLLEIGVNLFEIVNHPIHIFWGNPHDKFSHILPFCKSRREKTLNNKKPPLISKWGLISPITRDSIY